jgi:ribosome biogenesis protein SSF1/2
MRKQFVFEKLYQNAPLIVLNSLSGEGLHMKLMASMFQNMFPTINITKVRKAHLREETIRASNGFLAHFPYFEQEVLGRTNRLLSLI